MMQVEPEEDEIVLPAAASRPLQPAAASRPPPLPRAVDCKVPAASDAASRGITQRTAQRPTYDQMPANEDKLRLNADWQITSIACHGANKLVCVGTGGILAYMIVGPDNKLVVTSFDYSDARLICSDNKGRYWATKTVADPDEDDEKAEHWLLHRRTAEIVDGIALDQAPTAIACDPSGAVYTADASGNIGRSTGAEDSKHEQEMILPEAFGLFGSRLSLAATDKWLFVGRGKDDFEFLADAQKNAHRSYLTVFPIYNPNESATTTRAEDAVKVDFNQPVVAMTVNRFGHLYVATEQDLLCFAAVPGSLAKSRETKTLDVVEVRGSRRLAGIVSMSYENDTNDLFVVMNDGLVWRFHEHLISANPRDRHPWCIQ